MAKRLRYRTDRHNNPVAATYSLFLQAARKGPLEVGKDFERGEPFTAGGRRYYTARVLGDPIDVCIRLIDAVGFYTSRGQKRWDHTALPYEVWFGLDGYLRVYTIWHMYRREGGTVMRPLFQERLARLEKLRRV